MEQKKDFYAYSTDNNLSGAIHDFWSKPDWDKINVNAVIKEFKPLEKKLVLEINDLDSNMLIPFLKDEEPKKQFVVTLEKY